MRAVLVAMSGDNKVYYDVDAGSADMDGIIERPDGKSTQVDFFAFVTNSRNLKKLRTTAFHRRLWDEPQDRNLESWTNTFVLKLQPINDKLLVDVDMLSSVGKKKNAMRQKDHAAAQFLSSKNVNGLQTKSCCGAEKAIPHTQKMVFSSNISRKEAWVAYAALREIEGR